MNVTKEIPNVNAGDEVTLMGSERRGDHHAG